MLVFRELIRDDWNILHIARHEVTPEEVEEVFQGVPVVQQGKEGRSLVFGPTAAGRMLTAVLDPARDDVYYVGDSSPGEPERAGHRRSGT